MTDLAALVVRMQADNSAYIKALDQATKRLNSFQSEQNEALGKLGEKIAEAFAIEKIVEFGVSTIESLASLDKMSQSAGIAVEELSSLRLAAAASGISQEELGVSFKKLNVAISDAAGNLTGKAGVAFRALGVDVRNADGSLKSVSQLLPEIANKFQASADGPAKAAIAVALLGKAGTDMIPVLNQGAAGLDKFQQAARDAGIVIDEKLAKSAEEASQKFVILKAQIVDGFGAQLATKLLPALLEVEDQMEKTGGKATYLGNAADVVVGILKTMVVVPVAVIGTLKSLVEAFATLETAFIHLETFQWSKLGADISTGLGGAWQTLKNTFTFSSETVTAGLGKQKDAVVDLSEVVNAHAKIPLIDPSVIAAMDKADAKLELFSQGLKEQSLAFGLGDVAMVRFKLTTGQLAEDLQKAGAAGKQAAVDAIKFAEVLQTKKDDKSVEDFTAGIVKQIVALDAGGLALTNYELHAGALGLALDREKKKGEEYRQTILAIKGILIDEQDAKAVQALADKSDILAGRLNKAALSAFDLQNALLKKNLEAQNNVAGEAGLEQLATERAHVDALSKINELNLAAAKIQTDLGVAESKIALARAQGQIGDIQAGNQEAAVRGHAIEQLDDIYAKEKDIAAAANDPALVDGVKKFGVQIDSLKVQMTVFDSQIRQGLEGAFAHNFADLITGAKSFKQALLGFLQDIDKQFVDMIAKDYAQKLFAGASGSSAGGPLGGLSGLLGGLLGGGGGGGGGLASLFGGGAGIASTGAGAAGVSGASFDDLLNTVSAGGLAGGGTIPAGEMRLVGENGPEMAYSGSQDMQVVPNAGKNVNVTNHFSVQSANGTISRQSQMQVAAAAARSLSQASRRNN